MLYGGIFSVIGWMVQVKNSGKRGVLQLSFRIFVKE